MEQTDRCQRGRGRGDWERPAKGHILHVCIAQGHRQQCGEVGGRRLGGRGQSGGMEDICNSVNNFCKVLCTTVTRET